MCLFILLNRLQKEFEAQRKENHDYLMEIANLQACTDQDAETIDLLHSSLKIREYKIANLEKEIGIYVEKYNIKRDPKALFKERAAIIV